MEQAKVGEGVFDFLGCGLAEEEGQFSMAEMHGHIRKDKVLCGWPCSPRQRRLPGLCVWMAWTDP